ncbi:Nitroreductase family protein [Actinoplanes regularis]|uniref:Nitroreductase family protein n=1 Tax=Actinoplanes regularis TaxID=52697 RepID=A0A239HGE8_9ACTN|nr:hypothetical protein Are01nite_75350 [Actinoplanes regularis]SNS80479.1 Nitroreductase family protein [Actinoplanes regularis]
MSNVQRNLMRQEAESVVHGAECISSNSAVDLWARLALPAAAPEPHAEPVDAPGLRLALSLLAEGVLTGHADRSRGADARAVPSAGAVYPYEFAVLALENGEPTAFRVDVDRRACARVAAGAPVAAALDASLLAIPEDGGALVLILTRPWLSMRKYGDRGYLYAQLDAGHAAGSLALTATGRGAAGVLRLRFPREPLSDLLETDENCRQIHSAFLARAGSSDDEWTGWTVHDATDREMRGPVWRSWLESACWDSLVDWPEDADSPSPRTTSAPLARIRAGRQLPEEKRGLGAAAGWPELIRTRASSKAFTGEPVSAEAVWRAVSALSTPLETDLPDVSSLSATLVVRTTTEPGQDAVYRLDTGERQAVPLPSDDEVARACMQQRALAGAAAVLLLHVPRGSLAGANPPGHGGSLRELTFRCGVLGQLLYLGANRASVGVTGVGGFDTPLWRTLAGLPEGDEILYALLLGSLDDSGVKLDRLAMAYAQNER